MKHFKFYQSSAKKVKTALPILDYSIYNPDTGMITCTDLEFEVHLDVGKNLSLGMMLIPNDVISSMVPEEITQILPNKIVTESGQEYLFARPEQDVLAFPTLMSESFQKGNQVHHTDIRISKLINSASKLTRKDELRPAMTGVLIDSENIVATDAHKLIFTPHGLDVGDIEIIIPKSTASMVRDVCAVSFKEKHSMFKCFDGKITMYCLNIGDKFPRYKSVIPTDFPYGYVSFADKKTLIKAAKDILPFTPKINHKIKVTVSEEDFIIHAEDPDRGVEKTTKIKCDGSRVKQGGVTFGLNAKFLADSLNASQHKHASINLNEPNRAIVINDEVLLMPVML